MGLRLLILISLLSFFLVRSTVKMEVQGLKTTNTLFDIIVNSYEEDKVLISSSVALDGELEKSSSGTSTAIKFENLVVTESGSIEIVAKGSTSGNTISKSYTVEEGIQNISLKLSRNSIKVNKSFDLEIEVIDQYGSLWGKKTTLDISDGTKNNKASIKTGVYTKKITYADLGNYTITVESSDGVKVTKDVEVTENSLEIKYLDKNEITSKTLQSIQIKLDSDYPSTVYLRLECLSECSGLKFREQHNENITDSISIYVSNSVYTLNVYILSSGTFKWIAFSDDFRAANSNSFKVTNSVSRISSYFNVDSVTAYFPALYTIKVLGDDEELYKYPTKVTIYDQSGASSLDSMELDIKNGSETLNIYFKDDVEEAYFNVSLSNSIIQYASSPIYVYPNIIILTYEEDWIPKHPKDSFEFDIKIMDYKEKRIESTYGNYNLSFKLLSNESSLGGSQKTITTKNGQVKIDDLYLNSAGTYQLEILCDSCETYITEEFEIESDTCEFSILTLCVLGVIVFLFIFCSLVMFFADSKDNRIDQGDNNRINWKFHPFISLLSRQSEERRLINSLQLFVSELNILTLIGLFYFYYSNPTERNDSSFKDFYGRQVYKGATGWASAQAIGIPLFIFKVYSILNLKSKPRIRFYYYVTCIILASIDIGLAIWMSFIFCKGYIMFWTVNFLIFIIIDAILIQGVLTISVGCFKPKIIERDERNERNERDVRDEGNGRNERNPNDPEAEIIVPPNNANRPYDTFENNK